MFGVPCDARYFLEGVEVDGEVLLSFEGFDFCFFLELCLLLLRLFFLSLQDTEFEGFNRLFGEPTAWEEEKGTYEVWLFRPS